MAACGEEKNSWKVLRLTIWQCQILKEQQRLAGCLVVMVEIEMEPFEVV